MPYVLAGLGTLAFVTLVVLSWAVPGNANLRFVPRSVAASWRLHSPQPPLLTGAVQPPAVPGAGPDGLLIKQLVWSEALDPSVARPFPVLAAIDDARRDANRSFASAPDAEALDQLARQLVHRHWSDLVWMTGVIDQARFDELCAALDRECRMREVSAALAKSPS